MTHFLNSLCGNGVFFLAAAGLFADEPTKPKPAEPPSASGKNPLDKTVEQLAETVRKSAVVIRVTGRDGQRQGLGSGFVVAAEGLIATNLHVIGEARPISVQFEDGKRHEVIAVEAFDRALDLALLRVNASDLTPLPLGDSDQLKQGQSLVAVGNPRGLAFSVVSGVVSGLRKIDGRSMIQVAIPVETGNSGGPVLDMQGRVQGILTVKSLVTANLGFAVTVNSLKPMLQKPNPIPMERWLTIGALDPKEWKSIYGGRWRQRGGKIFVDGAGTGFGGRSLCLSQRPIPEMPYEVAVTVRLDDESGAAGLLFHADGGDKHYGFYPSAGQLRLTRFQGPDVYSWRILHQEGSPHYKPGDWNMLKVRIEKDKFLCFVNDHLVLESTDGGLTAGQVGLAKFRNTQAEFKHFQIAKEVRAAKIPPDVMKRIARSLDSLPAGETSPGALIQSLVPDAPASITLLRDRAKLLEQQAAQFRTLALAVHHRQIHEEIRKVLQVGENEIDLIHAALLVARLDNDELDVDAYRKEVDRMAREIAAGLPADASEKIKLAALNKYLFIENGFHGSRHDYYNKSNSYLNDVLDDREGLPITLSVLYLELARRIGLQVVGVGLPGHFIVRYVPSKGDPQLIDIFDGGKSMSKEDVARIVQDFADRPVEDKDLTAVTKKTILVRMLQNLRGLAERNRDADAVLRYLDTILIITPDAPEERGSRAILRAQIGRNKEALEDIDWLLEHRPAGLNVDHLLDFRRNIDKAGKTP